MKALQPLVSVVLSAALFCVNATAVDLHVHDAGGDAPRGHQHAPAAHHHDLTVPGSGHHDNRLTAIDADASAIPVVLNSVAARDGQLPIVAEAESGTRVYFTAAPTILQGIVSRAHGPPSQAHTSLRAPPHSPAC